MNTARRPLAIDLFCGLGGWTEGLIAEGWDVVGFDIERHEYGDQHYPGSLVIQDVVTLHGSQFRGVDLIVASPPCQEYSYMAMPWSRAKAKAAAIQADKSGSSLKQLNRLFDACFRIQRESCEAAGRHIPLIVENVKGAQEWVGRARWNFGSFYLWGDVPALMPPTLKAAKVPGISWRGHGEPGYVAKGFNTTADQRVRDGIKNVGGSWFNVAHNTASGKGRNPDGRDPIFRRGFTQTAADRLAEEGIKRPDGGGGSWFGSYAEQKARGSISLGRLHGSKSKARRHASAMIAKIPLPLSRYIATVFKPTQRAQAAE